MIPANDQLAKMRDCILSYGKTMLSDLISVHVPSGKAPVGFASSHANALDD